MSTLEQNQNGWRTDLCGNSNLSAPELSSLKHLEEVGAIFKALHLMQDIAPPSIAKVTTMGKQPSWHLRVSIKIHSTRLQYTARMQGFLHPDILGASNLLWHWTAILALVWNDLDFCTEELCSKAEKVQPRVASCNKTPEMLDRYYRHQRVKSFFANLPNLRTHAWLGVRECARMCKDLRGPFLFSFGDLSGLFNVRWDLVWFNRGPWWGTRVWFPQLFKPAARGDGMW